MRINIAGVTGDSIVDGSGIRLAIFAQGCPHNCPGCHNPGTHDMHGGRAADTREILKMIDDNPLLDGITLTGGEPFCQPEACAELAKGARARGLNVWAYTGWTYEELIETASANRAIMDMLNNIDVLVDGRFILAQRTLDARFRGSRNQRLIDVPASLKSGRAVVLE